MAWNKHVKGHDGAYNGTARIKPTKILGVSTPVEGRLNCPSCGTGNPVHGRPGEHRVNHKITCRTCTHVTLYESLDFTCHN